MVPESKAIKFSVQTDVNQEKLQNMLNVFTGNKDHLANAPSTFDVVNHSSPTFFPFESKAGLSCLICSSPAVPAQTVGAKRLPLNHTASCSRAYNISPFGPPSGAVVALILETIGSKSSKT